MTERARVLWLAVRVTPWAMALPLLKRKVPLPRLALLASASPRSHWQLHDANQIAKIASGIQRRLLINSQPNCLERALLVYRFVGLAGKRPRLVVGVTRDEGELAGHAWVTVEDRPLYEPPESLEKFSRLFEFDSNGGLRT